MCHLVDRSTTNVCIYNHHMHLGLSPAALWVASKKNEIERDRESCDCRFLRSIIRSDRLEDRRSLFKPPPPRGQRSLQRSETPPSEVQLCAPQRTDPTRAASVLQVVLADALSGQFSHHVVQVVGVGVAVAGQVGAELSLVVNLVPHDRVRLSRGAGRPDGEDQTTVPRRD